MCACSLESLYFQSTQHISSISGGQKKNTPWWNAHWSVSWLLCLVMWTRYIASMPDQPAMKTQKWWMWFLCARNDDLAIITIISVWWSRGRLLEAVDKVNGEMRMENKIKWTPSAFCVLSHLHSGYVWYCFTSESKVYRLKLTCYSTSILVLSCRCMQSATYVLYARGILSHHDV